MNTDNKNCKPENILTFHSTNEQSIINTNQCPLSHKDLH